MNAVTPPGISAAFLNAIENVLEQPSGGTETGKYFLSGWSQASGDRISQYMSSISRTSVPVSVTLDEADVAHAFCGAVASQLLTANGVQVRTLSNAGQADSCAVAGNLTFNF